jgi:predicted GIY-YIG superfamily endonuclease
MVEIFKDSEVSLSDEDKAKSMKKLRRNWKIRLFKRVQ